MSDILADAENVVLGYELPDRVVWVIEQMATRLSEAQAMLAAVPDYWLDGKVIRKGKEYVAEIIGQEPLLLQELLTGKPSVAAVPDEMSPLNVPENLNLHDANIWARGFNAARYKMIAAMLAAKAKGDK